MNKSIKLTVILFLLLPLALMGQQEVQNIKISDTTFSGVVGSGARAFGMGGAFISIADDATAASWNPGGLGQLEKPELTIVTRYQNFRDVTPASQGPFDHWGAQDLNTNSVGFDFLAFTYPIRIGNFKIVPQVSYQRAINFNLDSTMNDVFYTGVEWHPEIRDTAVFRGTFNETQNFTGGIDTITASLGFQFFKVINIGASVNFWRNGYEGSFDRTFNGVLTLENHPNFIEPLDFTTSEDLTMDVNGVNYNLGILISILDNLKVGAVYKSNFSADVNHSITVFEEAFVDDEGQVIPVWERSGQSQLEWPETWGVGLSFRPIDPLTISLDMTETRWSKAIIKRFRLPEAEGGEPGGGPPGHVEVDVYFPTFVPTDDFVPDQEKQLDTRQIRLGMEYIFIGRNTLVPIRLGFFTDSQYYSDAAGDQVNFFGFTGGFGVKWRGLSIDLAVIYETGNYLASNQDFTTTRFSEIKSYISTSYSF
ncbi:MAG: hypothetical protein GY940_37010 [bacterium]|nr:hypothetical protein [bacterium]